MNHMHKQLLFSITSNQFVLHEAANTSTELCCICLFVCAERELVYASTRISYDFQLTLDSHLSNTYRFSFNLKVIRSTSFTLRTPNKY